MFQNNLKETTGKFWKIIAKESSTESRKQRQIFKEMQVEKRVGEGKKERKKERDEWDEINRWNKH